MKITRLEVGNYKSIQEKLNMNFEDSLISFIGKNGSGKTNVLDAIFYIFSSEWIQEEFKDVDYRIFLELEDSTIEEFREGADINPKNKIIQAYKKAGGGNYHIKVDRLKSPYLIEKLEETKTSIYKLAKEMEDAVKEFNKITEEFCEKNENQSSFSIDVVFEKTDLEKSTNYGWVFNQLERENHQIIEQLDKIIKPIEAEGEIALGDYQTYHRIYYQKYSDFKLVYQRPKLTRFERKHIKIDEESIKKEINKINCYTKQYREKIYTLREELEKKIKVFNGVISDGNEMQEELNDKFDSMLSKIKKACSPKIYYLRNENNQLFFKKKDDYWHYNHSFNEATIIETFLKYQHSLDDKDNIKQYLESNKKEVSSELEKSINNHLPKFEKGIKIKINEELRFSIIEEAGAEVPFEQTNVGRRWYFTYFFVKGCLKPGDILLMDEPANNLHPEAQIQILKEIEKISKTNKVIITTHSPYMVSKDSMVYEVEMTNNGTIITNKDNKEISSVLNKLGISNLHMLLGDAMLNKELIPLDEITDKLRKWFKVNRITQEELAKKLGYENTRTIRRKLNQEEGQSLSYEDVALCCKEYNIDPIELMFKNK